MGRRVFSAEFKREAVSLVRDRTVRYDWLSQTLFESIVEVQDSATRWLWTYNNERPNMAIRGITPIQRLAMAA